MTLGTIYFLKCAHDASLKHFQQTLQLLQEIYPFDHPDKSISVCYLSHSFYLKGEYERALNYILDGAVT
jgi:hypothetical protein